MKITMLSIQDRDGSIITRALHAAFQPFGSLEDGVDGSALTNAILKWVDAEYDKRPGMAGEILRMVFGATTDQHCHVKFESGGTITLETPTSHTKINISRRDDDYYIWVNFGPEGSETRAMTILTAAVMDGIRFEAFSWPDRIPQNDAITALSEQAEAYKALYGDNK